MIMTKIIDIFEEIKNTNSLNDKARIIKKYKDDELFKKCLKFLLDDMIVTGISEKKISKEVDWKLADNTYDFDDVMNYLSIHNTGSDKDIAIMRLFLSNQSKEYEEFYKQMITKTYRLGCNAKTINKIIPDLIPIFSVQLGTPIEKCNLKDNEYIYLSRKLNGTRCAFIGDRCMTRQGKEYKGLDHIVTDLQNLGYSDYFVDGELLYKNEEGLTDSEAFQKGTGIAMSKDTNKHCLKLVIFDIFPLNEFWSGKSKDTYAKRKLKLIELSKKISTYETNNLEIVPFCYEGTDHSQIWKWLDYAEKNDWEGCMINLDVPYECKRTKNLMKVKKFYNYDLEIVGYEEGSGRNKGTLGAFIVKYKNNTVNVGSGFTDEERKSFWNDRKNMIGKIIEVKYKEETVDKKTGLPSIQFPIYVCMRTDKSEESYN